MSPFYLFNTYMLNVQGYKIEFPRLKFNLCLELIKKLKIEFKLK